MLFAFFSLLPYYYNVAAIYNYYNVIILHNIIYIFITIIISLYTCLFLQFNTFLEVGLLRGSVGLHTLPSFFWAVSFASSIASFFPERL